ncbi:hypothetical protein VNI00_000185 [Paramarasmius palmivorus]|uniref:DNA endonuclease activator Ctp1 C-terminal domain-containing protein n=1 Tax=Paramarasmius palmivorus TaxID=297713 RepID=A0AAW0EED2_9AGAR
MDEAITSSELRERDKIIEQKYEKELEARDAKAAKWRRAYDELSTELFNERNNCLHLVRSLGFETVKQAQLHIESSDNVKNEALKSELKALKDGYEEKFQAMRDENDSLKQDAESRSDRILQLEMERRLLEQKYDQLANAHTEATAKHLREYQRFQEVAKTKASKIDDSNKRMKYAALTYMRRIKRVGALGQDASDEKVLDLPDFDDVSPIKASVPSTPSKRSRYTSPLTPTTRANVTKSTLKFGTSPLTPLSSTLRPSSPLASPSKIRSQISAGSSDTEDETQFDGVLTSAIPDRTAQGTSKRVSRSFPKIACPHPYISRTQTTTLLEANTGDTTDQVHLKLRPLHHPGNEGESAKRTYTDLLLILHLPMTRVRQRRSSTPDNSKENFTTRLSMSVGRAEDAFAGKRSRSRNREMPPPVAPASVPSTSRAKNLDDYSAYKGRGRYARHSTGEQDKTLNELYEINREQNDGLGYEYDEVVRGRESRKKLAAGDCEDCREYYERIGPMPPRLQQPRWRSPTASPTKKTKHCNHRHKQHTTGKRHASPPPSPDRSGIESHKQAISRHRFRWARGKTPPGYWDIGFPDTQEAVAINQKANEMHQQKRNQVEKEAMSANGRYKRR